MDRLLVEYYGTVVPGEIPLGAFPSQMRKKKRVLRRLGYCDSDGVIQLKGRVACEINTCDELVVTELIFSGVFNELTPEQSAALSSCLVHQVGTSRLWFISLHQ